MHFLFAFVVFKRCHSDQRAGGGGDRSAKILSDIDRSVAQKWLGTAAVQYTHTVCVCVCVCACVLCVCILMKCD